MEQLSPNSISPRISKVFWFWVLKHSLFTQQTLPCEACHSNRRVPCWRQRDPEDIPGLWSMDFFFLCAKRIKYVKHSEYSHSSFQILYANEGESKKEGEDPLPSGEKSSYICHKGHEFIPTIYHFPTNCEACTKPLWNMFKPPPALECRRCHIKCHKDHMDKKEEIIAPCKGRRLHTSIV